MRIGIDFDNTLVCYDGLFHAAALEMGLIPADCPETKNGVRDFLRAAGREPDWTRLQGEVYGRRMRDARPFPGARDFLAAAQDRHALYIVSHKTRHPVIGAAVDLHAAARVWLKAEGIDRLVASDAVFFEQTRAAKLARIGALGCDLFMDDLPETLSDSGFPAATRAVLFDPDGTHGELGAFTIVRAWREVVALVEEVGRG